MRDSDSNDRHELEPPPTCSQEPANDPESPGSSEVHTQTALEASGPSTVPMTRVNPLLAFSTHWDCPFQFDLLHEPGDTGSEVANNQFQYSVSELLEPATYPPITSQMVIISPLPWRVEVTPRQWTRFSYALRAPSVMSQDCITILDVLDALCNSLHMFDYGETRSSPFYNDKDSVKYSFQARIDLEKDSEKREKERQKGMKRLDYLCGRTRFLGLSTRLDGRTRVIEAHFSYGKLRPGIHCVLEPRISRDAAYNSIARSPQPRCHTGTRQTIRKFITQWVDDPSDTANQICWLYGPAGSGKSAIAQSVSESCSADGKLAASFFFFRADPNRNTANLLFATLSLLIAKSIPQTSEHIDDVLLRDPKLLSSSMENQFKNLIELPFQHIDFKSAVKSRQFSKLIVIDGVDECDEGPMQQKFLTLIQESIAQHRIPLRFLFCSRPEPHLRDAFRDLRSDQTIVLFENEEAIKDIRTYFEAEFRRIERERRIELQLSKKNLEHLVEDSSGNFIYPATVIRFVDDSDTSCDPKQQLNIILKIEKSNSSPFGPLDRLYLEVLDQQAKQLNQHGLLREFLPILVVLTERKFLRDSNNTSGVYRALLGLDAKQLSENFRKMHSLLGFSATSITVYHKSFLDFLQTPARSRQYHVDKYEASSWLLKKLVEAFEQCVTDEQCGLPSENLLYISKCLSSISPRHLTDNWWESLGPLRQFQNDAMTAPLVAQQAIASILPHSPTSDTRSTLSVEGVVQLLQHIRYAFGF